MPEHSVSREARWLEQNYADLTGYSGQWIAVKGEQIVASDPDVETLAGRVTDEHGEGASLFAAIVFDRLG